MDRGLSGSSCPVRQSISPQGGYGAIHDKAHNFPLLLVRLLRAIVVSGDLKIISQEPARTWSPCPQGSKWLNFHYSSRSIIFAPQKGTPLKHSVPGELLARHPSHPQCAFPQRVMRKHPTPGFLGSNLSPVIFSPISIQSSLSKNDHFSNCFLDCYGPTKVGLSFGGYFTHRIRLYLFELNH